ncbi:homoserine dehydrogenase [Priestia taiwanensis]|uniref:Homoserine dehydrogenase n=1 Tax=Priestia taiwanensis TaxID=1347902 RepID=A0A917AVQ0_9BACI|nr:homoserine dehydrogenase [Priestia taiwanensis]MBM7363413.1 homoserine dehydrogenase [Priestia taiwanensis]GGE77380.1 homoserine dehydrogenase [Priestia taiwanensis]
MKEVVGVGLIGYGTVGSGVVRILHEHKEKMERETGCDVVVKKIVVRDKEKERSYPLHGAQLTTCIEDILEDTSIHVVVEVMGGTEEAKEYILRAFEAKKHVVTANKDLLAMHGEELLNAAARNGSDLYYEASVAGGIPILRGLVDGLASDRIQKVMGIVNGTTNYMLTKMTEEGVSYEGVLREAQALGFAESDPTADVDGLDAARKMVILATLGFSMKVAFEDVDVKGIRHVTQKDLQLASQLGYVMKLIGTAEEKDGAVSISVAPTLIPKSHPLAGVRNEYNAVYVYGEAVGQTMFYGPGAGQLPTATAVVSDIVTVVKHMRLGTTGKAMSFASRSKVLQDDSNIHSKYFLRVHMKDETGTFLALTKSFVQENISFDKILQLPLDDENAEVVVVTHSTSKKQIQQVCASLDSQYMEMVSLYRVEGE